MCDAVWSSGVAWKSRRFSLATKSVACFYRCAAVCSLTLQHTLAVLGVRVSHFFRTHLYASESRWNIYYILKCTYYPSVSVPASVRHHVSTINGRSTVPARTTNGSHTNSLKMTVYKVHSRVVVPILNYIRPLFYDNFDKINSKMVEHVSCKIFLVSIASSTFAMVLPFEPFACDRKHTRTARISNAWINRRRLVKIAKLQTNEMMFRFKSDYK